MRGSVAFNPGCLEGCLAETYAERGNEIGSIFRLSGYEEKDKGTSVQKCCRDESTITQVEKNIPDHDTEIRKKPLQ